MRRGSLGFSGIKDFLYGVGGESFSGVLKEAEKYTISKNRWTGLPNLIYERKWPGLCCFEELKFYYDVYCFCGYAKKRLKSIERYNGINGKWTKFEKDERTVGNFHLRALQYKDDILVFGGQRYEGRELRTMYLFDSNGKIKSSLCGLTFIPVEQGA